MRSCGVRVCVCVCGWVDAYATVDHTSLACCGGEGAAAATAAVLLLA